MTRHEYNRRSGRSSKWIRPEKRRAIHARDGHRCGYCDRDLRDAPARERTLDHLRCKARCKSGKLPNGLSVNHETNLITACLACNSARSARQTWERFARSRGGDQVVQRIRRLTRKQLRRAA